jgi:hypothetical protein
MVCSLQHIVTLGWLRLSILCQPGAQFVRTGLERDAATLML